MYLRVRKCMLKYIYQLCGYRPTINPAQRRLIFISSKNIEEMNIQELRDIIHRLLDRITDERTLRRVFMSLMLAYQKQ